MEHIIMEPMSPFMFLEQQVSIFQQQEHSTMVPLQDGLEIMNTNDNSIGGVKRKGAKHLSSSKKMIEEQNTGVGESSNAKKLDHNAKERVRRRRLNASFLALRALLPDSRKSKKGRSAPAIVDRVVKYIPEMEIEIKKLKEVRENMQKKNQHANQELQGPRVSVTEVKKGEAIIQICTREDHGGFSNVLQNIEAQGISIITASTLSICDGIVCYQLHIKMNGRSHEYDQQNFGSELRDKPDHQEMEYPMSQFMSPSLFLEQENFEIMAPQEGSEITDTNDSITGEKTRRGKHLSSEKFINEAHHQGSNSKRLEHNAKERIRRVRLKGTYLDLCALLPDSTKPKKGRSSAAIVDRVLEFIPAMETKIQKLKQVRDNYMQLANKQKQNANQEDVYTPLQEGPTVSVTEVKDGEAIIQICTRNKDDHGGFSNVLQNMEEKGIWIRNASTLSISDDDDDDTVCYQLHIQVPYCSRLPTSAFIISLFKNN